jgi:hypothetical protein
MGCFAKNLTEVVFPVNTFAQYHHQRKKLFEDRNSTRAGITHNLNSIIT